MFDLDGTLLDSYAAIHDSLAHVQKALAFPFWSLDETRRRVGRGLAVLMEEAVGAEKRDEGVRLFREHYGRTGPGATRLLPGAEEVTRALRERGVRLVIASNKPAVFSRQILSHLGIADRFGAIHGPDDGFPPKPAPQMVFMGLALVGVKTADALYVGDMPLDVLTARAAGLPMAAVPTGSSTREDILAAGPDVLLEGLPEVMHLFP